MAKTGKITIDEKGNFSVDLTGFEGQGCDDIIKACAEIGDITKEVHKREYFTASKAQITKTQVTGR